MNSIKLLPAVLMICFFFSLSEIAFSQEDEASRGRSKTCSPNENRANTHAIPKHYIDVRLTKVVDAEGNEKIVAEESKVSIPDDFPKYIDTGNPKVDKDTYHNNKQEWIRTHPVEFEKIKHLRIK